MNLLTDKKIIALLKEHHISITHQRIKILKYLYEFKSHPCVEDIFSHLKNKLHDVSKATVYNNLMVFKASGLINEITIEKDRVRYDADIKPHAHFYCKICGMVHDFNFQIDTSHPEYSIESYQIYLYGTCPPCETKKAEAS